MKKIILVPCEIFFLVLLFNLAAAVPAQAVRPREIVEQGAFGSHDVRAPLVEPSSLWFDRYRNRILVTSTGTHQVLVYSPEGTLLQVLGRNGGLELPYGVAADRSGNLYISEKQMGKIKVLRHYDEILVQETKEEYEVLPLDTIEGDKPVKAARLAVGLDDRLYVIDAANHRILVLNPDGSMVFSFGGRGLGSGQFLEPADLCMDPSGRIYVTDPGAKRILVFSGKGKYLYRLGRNIQQAQGFDQAEGIAIDRHNNLWMSDPVKQNLFVEDPNGNRILTVPESPGGGVILFLPVDLAFDTTDRLYVLEKGANAIRVFGVRY